jgi:hypothetical protein
MWKNSFSFYFLCDVSYELNNVTYLIIKYSDEVKT